MVFKELYTSIQVHLLFLLAQNNNLNLEKNEITSSNTTKLFVVERNIYRFIYVFLSMCGTDVFVHFLWKAF